MVDLKSTAAIYLKGFLFSLMLMICAPWLVFESVIWKRILLTGVVIWSSARLYYFMFYVIEKYNDDDFRFSGLIDFFVYLVKGKTKDATK
jgi:heme/copper-type cytochrome/quinol oxidase subunit 4